MTEDPPQNIEEKGPLSLRDPLFWPQPQSMASSGPGRLVSNWAPVDNVLSSSTQPTVRPRHLAKSTMNMDY